MRALVERLSGSQARPLAVSLGLSAADMATLIRFAARDERRGRIGEAIETLRVAAVLDPRDPSLWDALARCLAADGEGARAASANRVATAIRRASGAGQ